MENPTTATVKFKTGYSNILFGPWDMDALFKNTSSKNV